MPKTNQPPIISIIVPVYNVASYLEECLTSLSNQTFQNIEILVVDDGSTDGSSELSDAYALKDKRVRVIHQPNAGLGAARNTGIQAARGAWIMFVDSDDFLLLTAVEICVRAQKASGADLIVFPFFYVSEEGDTLGVEKSGCLYGFVDKTIFSERAVSCLPYHIACSKFYRKEAIESVLFSPGIHEDVDYSHRILKHVNGIFCLDAPLYCYRYRPNGLSKKTGIDRERNHWCTLAWMTVLEESAREGFLNTVGVVWPFYRYCLNRSANYPDDTIYRTVNARFVKWFSAYRHSLRHLPLSIYVDIRDASRKCARNTGDTKLSAYAKLLLFIFRAWNWATRHFKRRFSHRAHHQYTRAFIKRINASSLPRCIVLPTPHHDNLGDHMIAEAMVNFYESNGYTVVEVPMDLWKSHRDKVVSLTPKDATIAMIGGGNIGTLWPEANQDVLDIVSLFPDNKVVVFPETAFFSDDQLGRDLYEEDLRVFKKHEHLTLSFRDRTSYELFARHSELHCVYLPDSALIGYPARKQVHKKSNVALVCFRADKEAYLSEEQKNEIIRQLLEKGYLPKTISMHCGKWLDPETRKKAIEEQLDAFASASLVVCDTLHGMLFSWLAGTECACFDNVSKKVSGVYEWIKDYPWIHLCDTDVLPDFGAPITPQKTSSFFQIAKEAFL